MDILSFLRAVNDEYSSVIGAGTGIVAAGIGWRNLTHLRNDSKSRSRPYIYVEPVPGLHGNGSWDLRIANLGASIANDVRLSAIPRWEPVDELDRHTPAIQRALKDPITLPPGSSLRLMWRIDRPVENDNRQVAGAPENTTIAVTYKGDLDRKSRKRGYSDEFSIRTDLGIAVPVPTSGNKLNGIEEGKELRNIDRALRALARHVGELRR
ncbi:hypothetical protein ABH903_001590 [Brevibacterium epidermidis]|jgi:hypothetical protein|uniref:Uncharacterized protein n=1 Tax=Brevibacterium epidermidis TaxID=1698 RepID=A0ABV4EJ95_BREEP